MGTMIVDTSRRLRAVADSRAFLQWTTCKLGTTEWTPHWILSQESRTLYLQQRSRKLSRSLQSGRWETPSLLKLLEYNLPSSRRERCEPCHYRPLSTDQLRLNSNFSQIGKSTSPFTNERKNNISCFKRNPSMPRPTTIRYIRDSSRELATRQGRSGETSWTRFRIGTSRSQTHTMPPT